MREVTINGEPTMLVCSPLTPRDYRKEFKRDMLADTMTFLDGKGEPLLTIVPELAWVMAKAAKYPEPFPDFEAWMKPIGYWPYSDSDLMWAVVLEAMRGLFRDKPGMVAEAEAFVARVTAAIRARAERVGDSEEGGADVRGAEHDDLSGVR